MTTDLRRRTTLAGLALAACLGGTTPSLAGDLVAYSGAGAPGSIRVETATRLLYFILEGGRAWRYPVGVGRAGRQWSGSSRISGRFLSPSWAPPAAIRRDNPTLPDVVPGGSPANPMGAAAMTLTGGPYAIHGTNTPGSIGGFVSYGCIRMFNADILDLLARVAVGTRVDVVE